MIFFRFQMPRFFARHQYGATLGGPIIKDKAFFFGGFQGQRQFYKRRANPTVPFPEFWEGDLSRYLPANTAANIRDPQNPERFSPAIRFL